MTINKVIEIKINTSAGLKVGDRDPNFNSKLTKECIQELGSGGPSTPEAEASGSLKSKPKNKNKIKTFKTCN